MLPWQTPEIVNLSHIIVQSFYDRLRSPLLPDLTDLSPEQLAQTLYEAPVVVLAHDGGQDPRFTYANVTAQRLWEMPWDTFIGMPSRLSAEPDLREVRAAMLARVQRDGYIDDYQGIRISSTGQRFELGKTIVWNLQESAQFCGQAATFSDWTMLSSKQSHH